MGAWEREADILIQYIYIYIYYKYGKKPVYFYRLPFPRASARGGIPRSWPSAMIRGLRVFPGGFERFMGFLG